MICEAKYEKANLEQEVKTNSPQLKPTERKSLFLLLQKIDSLFDYCELLKIYDFNIFVSSFIFYFYMFLYT